MGSDLIMLTGGLILTLTATACLAVPSSIIRPCKLEHLSCIRDNLAANSRCTPRVRGSVPSEYTIPSFHYVAPYFNASYIDNNLIIRNHDKCRVSEFFFNLATHIGVLALDCPSLVFESTRTLIQHVSLREDTQYSYNFIGTYPMIRLTINFQHANALDLCSAFTFADVTALPLFKINPNDRKTERFLSTDLTFVNIYERETFYFRANQLARYYINSVLCDFGCNF